MKGYEESQKVILADAFAEAITWVEDRGGVGRAARLLDVALFMSRQDVRTNSPPLKVLARTLAERDVEAQS